MEDRIFKIFISSTFREMIKERDDIQQIAFSKLRFWGKTLGLQIVPIDLRWGITEKDIMSGKLARLCGDAVEGCTPYFVALLGNTYGTDDANALGDLYSEYKGKSLTDFEITKGVLEISNRKALIYNITYSTQKETMRKRWKLSCLKKEIKKHVAIIDINLYERLVKTVVNDIQNLILSEIKNEYTLSRTQKHFLGVKSCFYSQYYNRYYFCEHIKKFDDEFKQEGCYVIKAQESDAISMMMYNLAFSKGEENVIYHDFLMPEYSKDKNGLMQHVIDHISEETGRYIHLSDSLEEDMLALFGSGKEYYIFIDSMHLLETKQADSIMNMVTSNCFDGITFILSTYPGIEYFNKQYIEIKVDDFNKQEAAKFILSYIEEYKKNNNEELTKQIVEHILDIQGKNSIFLQLLMTEILMKGCPSNKIIEEIDRYKNVHDMDGLIKLIIERIIDIYEIREELHGIIRNICLSLCLAESYLHAEDIYAIGKMAGYQKENIVEALEFIGDFLIIYEDKYQFRYLSCSNVVRNLFADDINEFDDGLFFPYFISAGESVHAVYERCKYYERNNRENELVKTLLIPTVFCRFFYEKQEVLFDFAKRHILLFIMYIEKELQNDIYEEDEYLQCLVDFLEYFGELDLAIKLIEKKGILYGLNNLWKLEKARIYRQKGQYNYAESILLEIIQCEEDEEIEILIKAYDYLSYCQGKMGMFSESIKNSKKAIKYRKYNLSKYEMDLPISLNSLAYNYFACEKYIDAIELYEKSRQIRIKYLGSNHPRVASNMNNIGETYIRLGKYTEAIEIFKESLSILRNTLGEKNIFFYMCQTNLIKCEILMDLQNKHLDYEFLSHRLEGVRNGLFQVMGENDYTNDVDVWLGVCACEQRNLKEGHALLSEAFLYFKELLGENSYECKEIDKLIKRYFA